MLAQKVLDLAEQQGLLDGRAIGDLRRRVGESKFVVTPEAIAKVLVDHGHLTPYQARKLVNQALPPEPKPPQEELTLRDSDSGDLGLAEDADDEIVELEAVAPPPAKPAKTPSASTKPAAKVKDPSAGSSAGSRPPLAEKPAKKKSPAPAAPPAPAVADDDLAGLEPLSAAAPRGSAPAGKWKHEPQAAGAAAAELPSLDMLAADPLAETAPAEGLEQAASPLLPVKKARKNVWDSPLLLVGGGLLGVITIAFAVLLYSFTFGTATELFNKAEEEYRNGTYSTAITLFDEFLQRYESDKNASKARVLRGMAQLRQVADGGKQPRQSLEIAREVLPKIEIEEKFGDARPELASILPDIADGFAIQAGQATDVTKKEELVKLAGEAMKLINNPSYLPASLRKDRENRIAGILDKLQVAQRSIDQDRDLQAAIGEIKTAAEDGNAQQAYLVRDTLVRTYPALEVNPQLVAAIQSVGEKERQLVRVTEGGPAAKTDDPPAASTKVLVALRDGPAGAAPGKPAFVLVEGAAYGLDSASGRVLWRRFVGYESLIPPLALPAAGDGAAPDALVVDSRSRELLRLNGATGQLVWRQALEEPPTAPQVVGDRIIVTTTAGRIVALDAASGNVAASAQLPQAASVAATNGGSQSRLLQLGEHSTLFVLDSQTLNCTETVYLGHKAGAIFVPPAAVLDQVLVVESPADDYSLLRVLSPDAKTRRLTAVGRPIRLKGRVLTPLAVKGRRVALITDLGQLAVYEVDASNPQQPVRLLAGQDASESAPLLSHILFDGNRLWTAGKRCALFDVQAAVQQLSRKWAVNQDDAFIGPLSLEGDLLVHVRRPLGGAAVLVEGVQAASGQPTWTTHLASPIVALAVSESRKTVDVLTGEGRLFSLGSDQLRTGYVDSPSFAPPPGSGPAIWPEASLSADSSQLLWTESLPGGRVYSYNVAGGGSPSGQVLPAGAEAATAPQLLGSRVLVPLSNGSVVLLEPEASAPSVQPFLPPLEPNNLPLWTRPAVSATGESFLISDGRGQVYSVGLKTQPQPHLASAAATTTAGPVASALVQAGTTCFGVLREGSGDALAGFDMQGQPVFEPVALAGRWQAGPFAAGGLVLLTAEPEGLLCFDGSGKLRWQQPLTAGPLAGAPVLLADGDLLVVHQSGAVRRIDPASGAELAAKNVQEPLFGAARILGQNVFLAGSDGVVHRIALPQRP
jgi:outer membrane protein assembly factor BamB/TolA-binding protein